MADAQTSPKAPGRAWTKAEKAAAAAIGVNFFLTGLKFGLAWWSKSLALKVEAFHSFADIGSSLAVLWAVHAEMGRKDLQANSGAVPAPGFFLQPQRLVAILIGAFLLAVGLLFLRKVIAPETLMVIHPVPVSMAMLGFALLSFLLSRFEMAVGQKENCTALVADSFHARVDMFGSLVVAGALLGESLGWKLDRLAAGLIAANILTQALNVFGAVIRDLAKGELRPDYLYREWLWLAIEKRLPGIMPKMLAVVTRLIGGSPESAPDRKKAGAIITGTILAVVLVLYLLSGLFTVQANEKALVERLGKPVNIARPLGPGLHWRWPRPIAVVRKVDTAGIRRLNVGSAMAPNLRTALWTNQHYVEQFNLLTGENIFVDAGLVLHYRISDAAAWLYNTQSPEAVLASVTYSALSEEFSGVKFLETITSGRDELEARLATRVKDELALYQTGIEIVSLQVRDAHPPIGVAPAFENVVSATIEYETRINEAKGYANDLIPRARGEAAVHILSAQAEKIAAANRAAGDTELFNCVRESYQRAPQVIRTRLSIEAAEGVLPGREKIIVPANASSGAMELFMTASPGRPPQPSLDKGEEP